MYTVISCIYWIILRPRQTKSKIGQTAYLKLEKNYMKGILIIITFSVCSIIKFGIVKKI